MNHLNQPDAYLYDGSEEADHVLILAHGAGAGMDHLFMQTAASQIAAAGIRVVRFNFPYMAKRAEDGKKRPPDRQEKLLDCFRAVIAAHAPLHPHCVIGGKSMGGRMASLLADEAGVSGLVMMGFPFHPPGKPERYKGEHLAELTTPALLLQGERDTFGKQEEVNGYRLSEQIDVRWVADGDHSFKPRKASGYTEADNLSQAFQQISEFILCRS